MSQAAFLPSAAANLADGANSTVSISAVLNGKARRVVSITSPRRTTAAELKALLCAQGVVSVAGGLSVFVDEGKALGEVDEVEVEEGQAVNFRAACQSATVTVLASAPESLSGDEDIYELVLACDTTGAEVKAEIETATAGALRPLGVFLPSAEEGGSPLAVLDSTSMFLEESQVLLVQRAPEVAVTQSTGPSKTPAKGLLSRLWGRGKGGKEESSFCLRAASALKVRGSHIICTSKSDWGSCAVFDVPDAAYFEVTVQLLQDAPAANAEGLTGRWMLGVVPVAAAEVQTERQRRTLMGLGHFVTVCHGHPAKVQAPSMPRGTCGEDLHALPGELRKGQRLTLRWAAAKTGGALQAQVDDGDAVTLPYAPAPFDEVRPCLVLGAAPLELRVLQLEASSGIGGA